MKQLLIFITHDFESVFQKTLEKVNASPSNDVDVIVLFDSGHGDPDAVIVSKFPNLRIIPISKISSSYDPLGHTLYLNYFRMNPDEISKYDYIWICENDVYFHGNLKDFISQHNPHEYDLLVSEYGVRPPNWYWLRTLEGFPKIRNIAVLVVIMRMSSRLLATLLTEIDSLVTGFVEIVLPHICINHNYSIQCFLPDLCGIITTDNKHPLIKVIKNDIANDTRLFIENKIYHPIKSCSTNLAAPLKLTKNLQRTKLRPVAKYLVVVLADDHSFHSNWQQINSKNFDIFVCYTGKVPGKYEAEADYYATGDGLKWPILARIFSKNKKILAAYDAVWFPDDNLEITTESISRMFDLFQEGNFLLGQPAMAPGSAITYPRTIQYPGLKLHFSNFVEVKCPIFSREALTTLGVTFSLSSSGWGLDFLWPHVLNPPQNRIVILDETPIFNPRTNGNDHFDSLCRKMNVDPHREMINILDKYGIKWQSDIEVYGGIRLPDLKPGLEVLVQKFGDSEINLNDAQHVRHVSVPGITYAVCISLERRPDRWKAFQSRAIKAGFGFVKKFAAIDGDVLDIPVELRSHKGAYGCLHSHAAIYRKALEQGISHVMIFEDDCVFDSEITKITEYLSQTIGKFSWIHMGGTAYCVPNITTRHTTHMEIASIFNTHAYVIDQALMKYYLKWLENEPFPKSELLHADRLLRHLCIENSLKMCVPKKPLAWQDKSFASDVPWGLPS